MENGKKLLMTMTGEIHQPVRLYYDLYDKAKVLQVFKTLQCVQFDLDKEAWVWLFQGETKKFKFATPYGKIPKHRRPLVLGVFHFPQDDVMWLDVRSHERATKAIVFLTAEFHGQQPKSPMRLSSIGFSEWPPPPYRLSMPCLTKPRLLKRTRRIFSKRQRNLEPYRTFANAWIKFLLHGSKESGTAARR